MARRSRGQRRRYVARKQKESAQQNATTSKRSMNPLPSRLMSLPAELRNRVWTAVFEGWTQRIDYYNRAQKWTAADKAYRRQPPLLSTCKQIYAEAVGIYYSKAIFFTSIISSECADRVLRTWLYKIGSERAKLVRNVRCHLSMTPWWLEDLNVKSDPRERHWRIHNHEDRLRWARDVAAANGGSEAVIKGDLWYESDWDRIVIWTSDPVETEQEIRHQYREGDEELDKWLEAKGSDVFRWSLRGLPPVATYADAHDTYRDRIE
ncbi:uncharacterized protein RHO25_001975 [Cercospora beticola]|uniref:2EXR domain-containing protein n=1 Tax=Cercospora beticola TaxID=122368 RepID=A0ABZ0NCV9_CERBT|nr:hypothetical protein RHO25_001975 [Cercospora beticola]CAK1354206.1 unnamed protein product [Cercospora beticola]